MYILCLFYIMFSNGLLTNNSTWCQNRGCICISSTRHNIWSNPAVSCIHSSHPDKYNNSVNRIISKEKEREDIQGQILQSSSTVFPHTIHPFYKNYSVSTCNPATPSNSAYRINSTTRNTTTTRLIPCTQIQGIFQ